MTCIYYHFQITAVMVLNIITCSLFSVTWVSLSSVGLIITAENECYDKVYTVSQYIQLN